jgi:sarcosine oxidase subunit alpha
LALGVQLLEAGVELEAILESGSIPEESDDSSEIRRRNVPILYPYAIKSAQGGDRVEGITAVQVDKNGQPVAGTEKNLPCDTVCISAGTNPAFDLLFLSGCQMKYDAETNAFIPGRDENKQAAPGIFAVGDVCRTRNVRKTILEGNIAGMSAALQLGRGNAETQKTRDAMIAELARQAN